jgi:hypothetical protein
MHLACYVLNKLKHLESLGMVSNIEDRPMWDAYDASEVAALLKPKLPKEHLRTLFPSLRMANDER